MTLYVQEDITEDVLAVIDDAAAVPNVGESIFLIIVGMKSKVGFYFQKQQL